MILYKTKKIRIQQFTVFALFCISNCISLGPKKSDMQFVNGKIIKSDIAKKWKYKSVYLGRHDFHANIKYEYVLNGKKYESERISYWYTAYNSREKAIRAIALYPLGKDVTVYYRKANPEDSYLEVDDDTKEELEE